VNSWQILIGVFLKLALIQIETGHLILNIATYTTANCARLRVNATRASQQKQPGKAEKN